MANRDDLPPMYFDRAGKPIDLKTWAKHHEDPAYYSAGEDTIDGITIRTIWHGLNTYLDEPPIHELFGTARIDADGSIKELETYSSEAEALAGHQRHVLAARRELKRSS